MITAPMTQVHVKSMDLTEQLNLFFIEHEKKAYTIAFMSLKNQDDALDVVQDVMIKFIEKYKNKKTSLWAALFYRMIQNRITDFHRKNTQKRKYFSFFNKGEENIVENVADDKCVSVLNQIDNEMKIDNLQVALHTLSSRQLQAFICRIWEGLSVAETAKSMKCSQGSVKTHLFRALKQIRLQIKTAEAVAEVEDNG
ncbi:MAG: sigma-70 family RNA polymerase sigma factor [Alcanivoracaceae bacterium]|nr:sigma-70 family RNA polymerase sigma factor [Alcanivoracaceae bacterium]